MSLFFLVVFPLFFVAVHLYNSRKYRNIVLVCVNYFNFYKKKQQKKAPTLNQTG